jgi:hypothetical protein
MQIYALENDLEMWSYECVTSYWRTAHTHEESPVTIITLISETYTAGIWFAHDDHNKGRVVLNLYNLDLQKNTKVTTHQNIIIELLPQPN